MRRLRAVAAAAPLPAAIVLLVVALAPIAAARVGGALGNEFAAAYAVRDVVTALVLGPCLAAAAAGGVLAVSAPTRAGLGEQVAVGPFGDRTAIGAALLFPAVVATFALAPSLVAFTVSLASSSPGGRASGLALGAAMLAAAAAGAVVAEGVQIAVRGHRVPLLGLALGLGAWLVMGRALGATPLGFLTPVGLALQGEVPGSVAIAAASLVCVVFGAAWISLASTRPEPPTRTTRTRHLDAVWRFPVPAACSSLTLRRRDVRQATVAALGFGAIGALVAMAGGNEPPGPFLLATTTTLLGSLVAALATFGVLAAGSWRWAGAPGSRLAIIATAWLVGLAAAAVPVAVVAGASATISGVDRGTAGVVTVLAVLGTAVATIAGTVVPWQGTGISDQLGSIAAFLLVAIATSAIVGLVAPWLTGLGVPGPGVAVVLCVLLPTLAIKVLDRRLLVRVR